MGRKGLPEKERLKRHKDSQIKYLKRLIAARAFLKKNHLEILMCNSCNTFGYVIVGRITESTVRLFCGKCKNVRFIKVSLPKRFIPTK